MFILVFSNDAVEQLKRLKENKEWSVPYEAVCKALVFLQENPRHPSLKTHQYESFTGPKGEKIFEAYAQNKTPGAYRVFFYYGPEKAKITILAIVKHP